MAIYMGDTQKTLFKGDYHPAEFYKGSKKITGYNVSQQTDTELSIDNTYNDKLFNTENDTIQGNVYQEQYRVGVLNGEIVQFEDGLTGGEMIVTTSENCKLHQRNTLQATTSNNESLGKHIIPFLCSGGATNLIVSGTTNFYWLFNGVKYMTNTINFTAVDGDVLWLVVNDDVIGGNFKVDNLWNTNGTRFKLDLADLQGKITNYLSLSNCNQITGSLADLQGKITQVLRLDNCQVSGVYIPISNIVWNCVTWDGFSFQGTLQTTDEVDQTLIAFASALQTGTGNKNVATFIRTNARSSASDEAVAIIKSYTWKVYCGGVLQ